MDDATRKAWESGPYGKCLALAREDREKKRAGRLHWSAANFIDDGTPGDPRDKMDVRDENLIALCQACHLAADLDHHIAEARKTRARKRHEQIVQAGQRRLI